MEHKILITMLAALGWSIVCLFIKMQIPSLAWWIVFLPFIAIGGLLSIGLVLVIMLVIFWWLIGDDFDDEIYGYD